MVMIWLVALVVIVTLIYYKVVKPLSHWKELGVVHKKPLPLFGNSSSFVFKTKPISEYVEEVYNEFPNERYFGVLQFMQPALYIRDLELIKRITIKDFDHFMDRSNIIPEDAEPLSRKNLFSVKGQKWRDMRATLSPAFTSSKMKSMFRLICECAQEFTQYFEEQNESVMDVEMKDIFTRFTNDAIASVAFGFKCDSLREKTNAFYTMGKEATVFRAWKFTLLSIVNSIPFLQKIVKISLISPSALSFFRKIITDTIHKREKEGLVRPDMLNLLLEARKGDLKYEETNTIETGFATVQESKIHHHGKHSKLDLTDEDITAQALIFFFGGFETSATLLAFLAYELAVNQDVQEMLQNEIDGTISECNGKLSYEALHKMKYMDMVVSETLRKWPPGYHLDRQCVKDYVIEPLRPHEKRIVLEKGFMVLIPVIGIHRDPEYFKNPLKFDPERFSDENKINIEPYSYMPFGSGPRNCIASRFALMENKTLIFHLLSKFNIVVTSKTQIPLKLTKGTFNLSAEKGFWLGLERRKGTSF